jgi:hypothetical protein
MAAGIGRVLLTAAEGWLASLDIAVLQAKTLSPSEADSVYDPTRSQP